MKHIKPFLMLLLATAGSCTTWSCTASSGNSMTTSSQSDSNLLGWVKVGVATVTVAAVLKHTIYNPRYRVQNDKNCADKYAAEKKRVLPNIEAIKACYLRPTDTYHGEIKEEHREICFNAAEEAESYSLLKHFLFSNWAGLRDSYNVPIKAEIAMIKKRNSLEIQRLQDEKLPIFANNSWRPKMGNAIKRWNAFWSLV